MTCLGTVLSEFYFLDAVVDDIMVILTVLGWIDSGQISFVLWGGGVELEGRLWSDVEELLLLVGITGRELFVD